MEKWVVENNEDGKSKYWNTYTEYLARKFISEVFSICTTGRLLWGIKPFPKEEVYRIAKEIYEEKYKDTLPISYLEYYNKKECIQ